MDEILIPILGLVFLAVILSALILPIVALVISIRSRKALSEQIARIVSSTPPPGQLQPPRLPDEAPVYDLVKQLEDRINRLEAALKAHSITVPESQALPSKPIIEQPIERPIAGPTTQLERGSRQGPFGPIQAERIES